VFKNCNQISSREFIAFLWWKLHCFQSKYGNLTKNTASKKTSMKRGIVKWNRLCAHCLFCFQNQKSTITWAIAIKCMSWFGVWFFFWNFEFWANNTFMAQHDLKFLFCIIVEKSNGNRFRGSSNHFMLFLGWFATETIPRQGVNSNTLVTNNEIISRIYKYW